MPPTSIPARSVCDAALGVHRGVVETLRLGDEIHADLVAPGLHEPGGHRARRGCQGPTIDAADRQDGEARRGQEYLVGGLQIVGIVVAFGDFDAELRGEFNRVLAHDAEQDVARPWRA